MANYTLVKPSELEDALAVAEGPMRGLWLNKLQLPADGASCSDVCTKVTSYLRSQSFTLPPTSDTGCYHAESGGEVVCDLDLTPRTLEDLIPAGGEFSRAKGWEHRVKDTGDAPGAATVDASPERSADQVAVQIANLFRIYPLLPTAVERGGSSDPAALRDGWQGSVWQRGQQAQAWVSLALRRFQAHQTADHVKAWFGSAAVTDPGPRAHIQRVMNSISHVLSTSTYVYPGPECDPGDIAYVYACDGQPGDRDRYGRHIINLCQVYWQIGASEQIVTLAHEASHHSAACTEDVTYGSGPCRQLARGRPRSALRNADNFGYFVRDVAR